LSQLVRIEGLVTCFGRGKSAVPVLDDVSLEIGPGEAVALVGESGSGKTMTALSLMRLLPPGAEIVGGSIMFKGVDLLSLNEREMRTIRGADISMVFQDPMTYLNPLIRVGEQITETVQTHRRVGKEEARRVALDILKRVRMPSPDRVFDTYPHQLSGGMRQRVLIAIAISCRPALVIADEPTTALDVTVQAQIMMLLTQLHRELKNATLLITHDLGLVAQHCDRVYVMYAGQVVEEGNVYELFQRPGHPYTAALMGSTLSIDRRKEFVSIQGQPPDLHALPTGCRFHPRCPSRMDICSVREPPIFQFDGTRKSKCWLRDGRELSLIHI